MAGFGRSNSLSINTGSSNLFGNQANQGQQQPGSLFNLSTNAASQPASTGGLFASSTSQAQPGASQPAQTTSLFGGAQPAQPQAAGGLFGNLNKPAATGTTGGLFGSSTAALSQPQSGGLFGGALGANAQNQNQNPNQGASQSGGLFGNKPATGLFGAPAPQQTTPSLFGNTNANAQQNQASAPSLFGSTAQNQPKPQSSMFGGMSTQNQPLNQSAQQGGLQIRTLDAIKGTTRFSDLAPDLQNEIQALDNQIQYHISNANKCREIMPQTSERVASLAPDVAYIEQYLNTSELGIDNDSKSVAQLNAVTKKDQEEAALNGRAIENYKLPQQYHYGNRVNPAAAKSSPSTDEADDHSKPVDLVTYFSNRTENLSNTLDVYQRQIREIEGHLRHMEAGTVEKAQQLTGSRSGVRDQRRELVDALQAIERAILESAKKVGQTRDLVTQQTMGSVGGSML